LASKGTKRRILIVDDEPDITTTLHIGLEGGGFDVDAWIDPELVLSNFRPGLYDLVLVDIRMPKMDGFELYKQLKNIDPDVKVCFLTASGVYHEKVREKDLSNDVFIQKPITTCDLIREIDKKIDST
jgi:two-component system, OmpR family, response regulator ChvI